MILRQLQDICFNNILSLSRRLTVIKNRTSGGSMTQYLPSPIKRHKVGRIPYRFRPQTHTQDVTDSISHVCYRISSSQLPLDLAGLKKHKHTHRRPYNKYFHSTMECVVKTISAKIGWMSRPWKNVHHTPRQQCTKQHRAGSFSTWAKRGNWQQQQERYNNNKKKVSSVRFSSLFRSPHPHDSGGHKTKWNGTDRRPNANAKKRQGLRTVEVEHPLPLLLLLLVGSDQEIHSPLCGACG